MKKEFILEQTNKGRFLGMKSKIAYDDENLGDNHRINCEVLLSDYEGFNLKKHNKVRVTIEEIQDIYKEEKEVKTMEAELDNEEFDEEDDFDEETAEDED